MFYNFKKNLLSVSIIAAGMFFTNFSMAQCPVITCPSNIIVNNDPGACNATVTYVTPVGTSTCSAASTAQISGGASGTSFNVGITTNTFRVSDNGGLNTADCSFTVQVIDAAAPIITGCPSNISLNATFGSCDRSATWTAPLANDNCIVSSFTTTATSGTTFPVGNTVVTYTARDAAPNSSTCSFTVTITDNQNPSYTVCPSSFTVSTTGACNQTGSWTEPGASDNCSVNSETQTHTSGSLFPVGVTAVSYTAKDPANNSAVCSFNVTVLDAQNPVPTCPSSFSVVAVSACAATATYTGSATDNCGIATSVFTPVSGSSFNFGANTVTYNVTDVNGRTASCSFTVTITDNVPPSANCPANISIPAVSNCSVTVTWTTPSQTDNCTVLSNTPTTASGSNFSFGSTVVTYNVTDNHSNTSACSFTVTVTDLVPPAVTCPGNISIPAVSSCTVAVTWTTPSPTDNCTVISTVPSMASGSSFGYGVTAVTYTVTDNHSNSAQCTFSVTVTDLVSPSAPICPGSISVPAVSNCTTTATWATPATPTDNCTITSFTATATSGSTSFAYGANTVTYTVHDDHGNTNKCSFTVTVTDAVSPTTPVCPGNISLNAVNNCTTTATWSTPATPTDNCTINSFTATATSASTPFSFGNTTVTYTAHDNHGNSSFCTFTVSVTDNIAPVISCAASQTVNATAGVCNAAVTYTASATDNCSIISSVFTPASGSTFAVGTTSVSYVVTDNHSNSASCSFNITVRDLQNPTITCPANSSTPANANSCSVAVTWSAPTTGDNCGVASTNPNIASGSTFFGGTTIVTYTVTDIHSNSAQCSFSVTVTDTQNPTIVCPASFSVTAIPGQCNAFVTYTVSPADNCPIGPSNLTQPSGSSSGSFFNVGTTINTFLITDGAGRTASCSFQVTVTDNVLPVITACPNNATINTTSVTCGNTHTWTAPTASDNCILSSFSSSHAPGSTFLTGTTTVTYLATDNSGNTATCSFVVTVIDNVLPVLNCQASYTVATATGQCGKNENFTEPVGTDNCAPVVTTRTAGLAPGSFFPKGITTQTYQAVDPSGNSTSCSFNINVIDTELPTITCPSSPTVNVSPSTACTATVTYGAITSNDNCSTGLVTVMTTSGTASGDLFSKGATTVSYKATDAAGNSAVCSFSVTVVDNVNPSITCPSDIFINVNTGLCTGVATFATPAATDNCPGPLTVALTTTLTSGSNFPKGTNVVTFKATDVSLNTFNCSFNVVVTDNISPTISCPSSVSLNNNTGFCSAVHSYTVTSGDNCPGSVQTQTGGLASGAAFPVGTTVNTFQVTDASGGTGLTAFCSFSVTVTDTELPQINCGADITVSNAVGLCAQFVAYTAPVGTDNCAGATTVQLSGSTSGSSFPVGTTNNLFEVTDAVGLKKQCILKITVQDTSKPVITSCPSNITLFATAGTCTAAPTWSAPTATDNCSAVNFTTNHTSGSSFTAGVTAVNYVAKDNALNSAVCNFTVTVTDNQPPVVTCPAGITISAAANCTVAVTYTPTATDNCGVSTLTSSPASGSSFAFGVSTVTCTATDIHNNVASCTFTVNVTDNVAPVVTCPANISMAAVNNCTVAVTYTATATDNCGISSTSFTPASGSSFAYGTTLVTYAAIDIKGNTAQCTFSVTVTDVIPPVVTCPANITMAAVNNCTVAVTYTASATDNCTVTSTVFSPLSGTGFAYGVNPVTYTATDNHSNSAQCTFTVTVTDLVAPSTPVCPANISVPAVSACAATATWATPATPTDNCTINSFTATATSGSTSFPYGNNTVTYTAHDNHGNSSMCSFTVTVTDLVPPTTPVCPSNITVSAVSACMAPATWATPATPTDNCTINSFTATATSGSSFAFGNTTVTYTAHDNHGNSSMCSFTVTVTDAIAPTVTCPSSSTVMADAGLCSALVTYSATATDNCSVTSTTFTPASGTALAVGATSVVYKAIDVNGNSATCTFTVTVVDNQNPVVLNCPLSTTVATAPGQCDNTVSWPTLTGSDNCSSYTIALTSGLASGSTFTVGVTPVSYKITDQYNNTSFCNFNVTIADQQAPSITCPSNTVVPTNSLVCTATVSWAPLVATDNCPGTNVTQPGGLTSGSAFPTGTTTNSFVVTDASGNTNKCSFTVTVIETVPPVITCISNISVNTDLNMCSAVVTFAGPTFSDNCSGATVALTSGNPSGFAFPTGVNVNTYVATDAALNSAACSFTITVSDAQAPSITCSNIMVNNDPTVCGAVVTFVAPVGTDNCPGVTTVRTAGANSGTTFPVGTTTQTYLATDAAGNSTSCSFTIMVMDAELPVITLCQPNITTTSASGVCGNNAFWPTPTFTDNCSGASILQTNGLPSGSTFPVGVHAIAYTVTDASLNTALCTFTVTIIDAEKPSIGCLSNITVPNDPTFCSAVVTYATMNVTDNCPGAVLTQLSGLASGANFPAGVTQNVFIATDASGNVDTCKFTVSVIGTVPPTIACPSNIVGNNDVNMCSKVVTFTAPVGVDNCPGASTALTTGLASGSAFPVGATLNTYVVTDASGNSTACSFSVTISDNQAPVIACVSSISQNNDPGFCGAVVTYNAIAGTDNCPGAVTVQTAGLPSASTFSVGTTVNTYKVTDASGNSAVCSFNVTVVDTEAPVITCGSNISKGNDAGLCAATVTFTAPVATDNCPGVTTSQTAGLGSGSLFPIGVTVNTFKATGIGGNTVFCSFTVTVVDTEAPAISCGANITVANATGQCAAVVSYATINGNDNCAGATTTMTAGLASGSSFPVGITANAFKVVDAAGNSAVCTFSVTVNDTELPVIACGSNITLANTTGQCSAIATYAPAVATDNCTGVTTSQTAGLGSGVVYPVGITVNTFKATDAAGNSSVCSFNITVVDTQKPTIVCGSTISVNADSTTCSKVVTYAAPVGADNCSGVTVAMSSGLASGTAFPTGTTTVTYVVTDAAGNKDSCSFNVIVTKVLTVASYTASPAFTTVTFTNTSTGATGYAWTFGDGGTSTVANPVHSYTAAGTYTVCLVAFNACDTTTYCDTINVIPDGIVIHGTNASVNAYPNPTMNVVNLEVMDDVTRTYTVRMVNFVGQEVYSDMYEVQANDKSIKTIDLSTSPAGMYMITVISQDGKVRMHIPVIRN